MGDRGGGWLQGGEDYGGVTSREDCDKVTVGVVGEVVGEGEGEDGMEKQACEEYDGSTNILSHS